MTPTPPDYTPGATTIERAALATTALATALGALWLGVKRVHRFVGRAAFKPEMALIAKIPALEEQTSATAEIAGQFRELLDRHAETQKSLQRVSEDITAMRQEHSDGMTRLDDKIGTLAREVSEIRGEMKGRDAIYDRRRS